MEFATSKILFSANKDSTSSLAMMSPFFKALMAKYSPVFLYLLKNEFEEESRILGCYVPCQYNLAKVTSAKNGNEVEAVEAHASI